MLLIEKTNNMVCYISADDSSQIVFINCEKLLQRKFNSCREKIKKINVAKVLHINPPWGTVVMQ